MSRSPRRMRSSLLALAALGLMSTGGTCVQQVLGVEVGVQIDDAGGFQAGDPVEWRGVRIGEVKEVTLDGGRPTILCRIEGKHAKSLHADAQFVVRTPGLLGGDRRAVEVVHPGTGTALESGARVQGVTPGGLLQKQVQKAVGQAAREAVKMVGEASKEFEKALRQPAAPAAPAAPAPPP